MTSSPDTSKNGDAVAFEGKVTEVSFRTHDMAIVVDGQATVVLSTTGVVCANGSTQQLTYDDPSTYPAVQFLLGKTCIGFDANASAFVLHFSEGIDLVVQSDGTIEQVMVWFGKDYCQEHDLPGGGYVIFRHPEDLTN